MTSQSEPELFREICSRAKRIEQLYVFLPVCWRKSKFMIFDLKNAAQYNGTECIAKGVDPGSGRIMTRLLNQDQNELLIKHENLQLVNLNLDEKSEPVLCKAKERLSVSSSTSVPMTREGLASSIVNLTQGLLDVTFAIENNMVDDDFSNKSLFREILSTLKGVEDLCLKYCACFGDKPSNGTEAMKEVLGDGMAECVHWRRGALAYMFTAVEANFQHELELSLIEEGLEQFESMLGTRGKKYQEDADDCEGNEDVREMLKNSILSDTHLLSVVYSGEMCYWAWKDQNVSASSEDVKTSFRARAVSFLKKYLHIVSIMTKAGPNSVGSGWDTTRAESLISELQGQ